MVKGRSGQKRYDLGPKIKRIAISDKVISRFKALIARRVLKPGCRLPAERELAESLGVSRPTLRQALKALQILGIIQCRQGDGCYLAQSASDVLKEPLEFALALKGVNHDDLFETRLTLEVRLAGLAAERRTEENLEKMRNTLAMMKSSMGHPEKWCRYEMQFHQCIVEAARNAVMASIMDMLSRLLMRSRRETVRLLTDYNSSYLSHEAVYIQIEKQDPAAASRAMSRHFAIVNELAGNEARLEIPAVLSAG